MRKRWAVLILLVISGMLFGCGSDQKKSEEIVEEQLPDQEEDIEDTEMFLSGYKVDTKPDQEEIRQKYMDFLDGKEKVFGKLSGDYQSYSLDELMAESREEDMEEWRYYVWSVEWLCPINYAFMDIGQDGAEEMVLMFRDDMPFSGDGVNPNRAYIIEYKEGRLEIITSCSSGYDLAGGQKMSTLYYTGHLLEQCFTSAGSEVYQELYKLDKDGNREKIYTYNDWVVDCTSIFTDLCGEGNDYEQFYQKKLTNSRLYLSEFVKGDNVQISVAGEYSEDSELRAVENKMIEDFVRLGAKVVSEEELSALAASELNDKKELHWITFREAKTPLYFVKVSAYDGFVNLRTGPGAEYSIIKEIYNDTSLPVYEENGNWLKVVDYAGADVEVEGWVSAKYVIRE